MIPQQLPAPLFVARPDNSKQSFRHFPKRNAVPKEPVARPPRPARNTPLKIEGASARTAGACRPPRRVRSSGRLCNTGATMPATFLPRPNPAAPPPRAVHVSRHHVSRVHFHNFTSHTSDHRRTHPGPLSYRILATRAPQPAARQTLPRAARHHGRARTAHPRSSASICLCFRTNKPATAAAGRGTRTERPPPPFPSELPTRASPARRRRCSRSSPGG